MESLLEYLNRSSQKPIDYVTKVEIHYNSLRVPDGVQINAEKKPFLLYGALDYNYVSWIFSNKESKRVKGKLPSVDEWRIILENIDEVDRLLREAGFSDLSSQINYAWTSDLYDNENAYIVKLYHGPDGCTKTVNNILPKKQKTACRIISYNVN